jgi:hypothetical protein
MVFLSLSKQIPYNYIVLSNGRILMLDVIQSDAYVP